MSDVMSSPNEASALDIVIRRPTEADVPGLASHFSEMQTHYKRPVSDAAAIKAAALACKPPVNTFDPHVLIAVAGDNVVGSLVMNLPHSPAAELTLSLSDPADLDVAQAARRSGVGRLLVKKAAQRLRAAEGFSSLEWTTDSSNAAARKLYETRGARQMDRTYFNERRGDSERRGGGRLGGHDRRSRG